jgi:hypothetical protein
VGHDLEGHVFHNQRQKRGERLGIGKKRVAVGWGTVQLELSRNTIAARFIYDVDGNTEFLLKKRQHGTGRKVGSARGLRTDEGYPPARILFLGSPLVRSYRY